MFGLGVLGGIVSGIGGAIGGIANSATSYFFNRKMQNRQDALQRAFAEDSPELSKQGYEKAGLNPLLMYGNGPATEPISSPNSSANIAESAAGMINAAAAYKNSQSAGKTAETNENVGNSTIKLNASNIANNTAKTQADIYNDTRLTDAKLALMSSQIANLNSASAWNEKRTELHKYNVSKGKYGLTLGPLGTFGFNFGK